MKFHRALRYSETPKRRCIINHSVKAWLPLRYPPLVALTEKLEKKSQILSFFLRKLQTRKSAWEHRLRFFFSPNTQSTSGEPAGSASWHEPSKKRQLGFLASFLTLDAVANRLFAILKEFCPASNTWYIVLWYRLQIESEKYVAFEPYITTICLYFLPSTFHVFYCLCLRCSS